MHNQTDQQGAAVELIEAPTEKDGAQSDAIRSRLAEAIRLVQAEATTIVKDAENPHFRSRYASLAAVYQVALPLTTRHGLAWTAKPNRSADGDLVLLYRLEHAASGECEEGEWPLWPTAQNPQALASAITYARRHALMTLIGLVAEEDDDGNAASRQPAAPQVRMATAAEGRAALLAASHLLGAETPDAADERVTAIFAWIARNHGGDLPASAADLVRALSKRLRSLQTEGSGEPEEAVAGDDHPDREALAEARAALEEETEASDDNS